MRITNDYISDDDKGYVNDKVLETEVQDRIEEQSIGLIGAFEDWYNDLTLEEQEFYRNNRLDITEILRSDYL